MKLLNALTLLVRSSAPTTGAGAGAIYYDSDTSQPRYHDGSTWNPFGSGGFPEIVTDKFAVPDNRQVIYFDHFQNDGILTISGTGTLVGMR